MNNLLIHGCYDSQTLDTLKNFGVKEFSFDLRGRSSNLVTFRDLIVLLGNLTSEKVYLTFENDRKETILSYLNILKDKPFTFELIFRDCQDSSYYQEIGKAFHWMYHPDGDWRSILGLSNCKGILLPLKFQSSYQRLPELWSYLDNKSLDVYLHAENYEQTAFMNLRGEARLSIDLCNEIEQSFRTVDQEKLKNMRFWRSFHENFAR